jgi:hypothetical protein
MNDLTRHIVTGLVALVFVLPGCGSDGDAQRDAAQRDAPATRNETITVEGTVHCGPVRACTGESFLVYTEYGGKVILVARTATRTAADVQKHLVDGARVAIAGIDKAKIYFHQYEVVADQITFLPPESDRQAP